MDNETRETIIADLNKMLQESTKMIEKVMAIQASHPGTLGNLLPAIDAMGAFQREVEGYLARCSQGVEHAD